MKQRLNNLWREWLAPLTFGLLFTQFGATAVRVDGASMLPTLRHDEWLAVPKLGGWAHGLGLGQYERGDIVIFKPPRAATSEWTHRYRGLTLPWAYRPYLVKRIVGLPGDRVRMWQGRLYLNGQAVPERQVINYWNSFCHDTQSSLANSVASQPNQTDLPEIVVPSGSYFVMGDNRSPGGSLDSRVFGPVSVHDIAGPAVASLFPLFARAQATPPCDGLDQPERRVKYSGKINFNPRWLDSQAP